MQSNETAGVVVIILGVVLAVGAVRGTWRQVFNDLLAGSGGSPTAPGTHGPGAGIGGGGKPAKDCTPIDCITGNCDPLGPGCISGFPNVSFGYVSGAGAVPQTYVA